MVMNYIKEINAFYQRQETNPVSANAANLWHTLMHVNNRAGWVRQMTVAVSVLCCKSQLSESAFKRARKELHEKGYIHYESRGGNQSAIYQIMSSEVIYKDEDGGSGDGDVDDVEETDHSVDPDVEPQDNVSSKSATQLDRKVSPLYKQDKTKQKGPTSAEAGVTFFRENIGMVRPYIEQDIMDWVCKLGEPFVLAAMKRTAERGKTSWDYTEAILKSWFEKGFRTVADIQAEADTYRQGRREKRGRSRPVFDTVRKEVIPGWFHERGEKRQVVREGPAETAERTELAALIESFA